MSFQRKKDGKIIRYKKAVVDCSNDTIRVEQQHKDEVNINNIVKRHGIDLIAKTAALQQPQFDDLPNNDFQESMLAVTKAQQTFEQLPSAMRKEFNNSPAEFMDFIHNPDNSEKLVDMGLATRRPVDEPIEVRITPPPQSNSETPATPAAE